MNYQFTLAYRPGYIEKSKISEYELKITETEKVLAALIRALKKPKSLKSKSLLNKKIGIIKESPRKWKPQNS